MVTARMTASGLATPGLLRWMAAYLRLQEIELGDATEVPLWTAKPSNGSKGFPSFLKRKIREDDDVVELERALRTPRRFVQMHLRDPRRRSASAGRSREHPVDSRTSGRAVTLHARTLDEPTARPSEPLSPKPQRVTTRTRTLLTPAGELTLRLNDSPPPYRESENCDDPTINGDAEDTETILPCDTLDLLINCSATKVSEESEASYEEIEMGLWHSTPLSHRHKSKISLTWILKENLETKMTDKRNIERKPEKERIGLDRRKDFEPHKQYNKRSDRIVGRNEFYHNLRLRNACEEFVSQETCSDTSVGTEYTRRKHKHRHRRKKKSKFGYDIRDLDSFLSEASIDRPGNIPVVVAYPTPLYQTQATRQKELPLALGTVINAVFKSRQWLYAQTPHGHEGYVLYSACLPLGILPCRTSQKKTPCWESSTDIYRRPSGNFTDTEKEQMHVRTRSESRYRTRNRANCAEKDFDTLYLKTKSVCSDLNKLGKENRLTTFNLYKVKDSNNTRRHTLLVVKRDYWGSVINNTVTVSKGEVVVLVQERGTSDDPEWFYVRKKDGSHGYLPASVAGHGYI